MTPASLGAEVHALRQRTALFGHNAPDANLFGNADSNIAQLIDTSSAHWNWKNFALDPTALDLDTDNPKIVGGSWIALVSNEVDAAAPTCRATPSSTAPARSRIAAATPSASRAR